MTLTPLERHLLDRVPAGQIVPAYDSPAFHDLPAQDPRRAASIITAARFWRLHHDPDVIAAELRFELAQDSLAFRQASWDVSAAADWAAIARSPAYAELCDRRGEHDRGDQARARLQESA